MAYLKHYLAKAFLSFLLSLLVLSPVMAQTRISTVYVNHLTTQESDGAGGFKGLATTWDFLLLDENGHVISKANVDSASVSLANGDTREAQVDLNDAPWSIVIVVDAGQNMASSDAEFKSARQTLANSLEQLPDGANVAVLKFAAVPETVQKYSTDKKLAQKALQETLSADKAAKKSCLNNGVYEGINMLSQASSRRALLLLTASGDNCGDHSTSDVVKFAQENKVQIYAIGIQGQPVAQKELDGLSGPTGGLTAVKNADAVNFAFGSLFDPLKQQWQARATIYPTAAGQQSAKLTVGFKDKTSLETAARSFNSPRAYNPPPEIKMKGEVLSTFTGVAFTLRVSSQSLIKTLDITIENKKTGGQEYSQKDVKINATDQLAKFDLNIPKLTQGAEYTLQLDVVDINGGKLAPVVKEFKYQPEGQLEVKVQSYAPDQKELTVQIDNTNLNGVGKYQAWLAKECGNPEEIAGTKKDVPLGDAYKISLTGLDTGAYHVAVQAVDQNNQVLMSYCDELPVKYTQPSWWAKTVSSMKSSPLAIAGITLVALMILVLLVAVAWVWRARSSRPKAVQMHFPKVTVNAPTPNLDAERSRAFEREPPRPVQPAQPFQPAPVQAPVQALPVAWLTGRLPNGREVSTQIHVSLFKVGRAPENELMLDVDKSSGVSRHHATIAYADGRFTVEDVSSFGTFVDGQPVAKGARAALRDGAVIQFGPTVQLKFTQRNAG